MNNQLSVGFELLEGFVLSLRQVLAEGGRRGEESRGGGEGSAGRDWTCLPGGRTSWMLVTSSAVWIRRLYIGCLVSLPFLFRSTACGIQDSKVDQINQ